MNATLILRSRMVRKGDVAAPCSRILQIGATLSTFLASRVLSKSIA